MDEIVIIGGGIGGLTLALALEKAGIPSRIYEAAAEIRQVGVGINVLPYATEVLAGLGLEPALAERAIATREAAYFSRSGVLIHREPVGRFAGLDAPQFSIHRADLVDVLLGAVRERLGADRVTLGARCVGARQTADGVTADFVDRRTGAPLPSATGAALVGCDGIHSTIRAMFYPHEAPPRYSGVFMWRGVSRGPRLLTGASMVRAGVTSVGKMVVYPIKDLDDGRQLLNWVAELDLPDSASGFTRDRDWNKTGDVADFAHVYADWRFDWLDVPAMIRDAEIVLRFPMMDRDPVDHWSFGRITLLGDAAHPIVPLGSNGAGQAILDARALADSLALAPPETAFRVYERRRLPATTTLVMSDRAGTPDERLRAAHALEAAS
ncbi:2-polyprenyl-6-methoxyphenol hydroxylase-like FAD-dependent oxidoreductase [Methylopila capsulata]|uniref:2-polyprenyl-6-methoxyphenol hydroxylase-like FAD-dependent oxidoreductase n=1 Tax=Methylopila capsulata TaxID=61654 RepID=A0A9W6MT19_9HYPH|nr:FAD-dependent monooxygenase [Methylopila capsulata]MBM7852427.1 2-polyprenyl-6-methoxyphenol hydroxylase-like FAD-dependent oxidoreductase [Methylopila capsulata]GLK56636.1 flavin-dependent oxidoreductase [Methylopila capsulata]